MSTKKTLLLVLVALSACNRDRSAPARTAQHVNAPSASPIATNSESEMSSLDASSDIQPELYAEAFCSALRQHNRRVLREHATECSSDDAGIAQAAEEMARASNNSLFAFCDSYKGGWALQVKTAAMRDEDLGGWTECGVEIEYSFVEVPHVGVNGAAVYNATWTWTPETERETRIRASFDYDGDGRDELVVQQLARNSRYGSSDSFLVLHSRDGTLTTEYPPGFEVTGLVDFDGDGRPDFLDENFFAVAFSPGEMPYMALGVPLLVHSLPDGTFSMNDEVARRWALHECPVRPKALPVLDLAQRPEWHRERLESINTISCALLWGERAEEIVRQVRTAGADPGEDVTSRVRWLVDALSSKPLPFPPLTPVAEAHGTATSRTTKAGAHKLKW